MSRKNLVSRPSDSFTKSMDLVEDRIGSGCPDKGCRVAVSPLHEAVDLGDEVSNTAKCSASNSLLGDDVEPDLDLVEPGRIGRRVMDRESGSGGKPASHFGMFVRPVVVGDEMDVEILRHVGLNET